MRLWFAAVFLVTVSAANAEDLYVFRKGPVFSAASQADRWCKMTEMAAESGEHAVEDIEILKAECTRLRATEAKPSFDALNPDLSGTPAPAPDRLDELQQEIEDLKARIDELEGK